MTSLQCAVSSRERSPIKRSGHHKTHRADEIGHPFADLFQVLFQLAESDPSSCHLLRVARPNGPPRASRPPARLSRYSPVHHDKLLNNARHSTRPPVPPAAGSQGKMASFLSQASSYL